MFLLVCCLPFCCLSCTETTDTNTVTPPALTLFKLPIATANANTMNNVPNKVVKYILQ